MKAKPSDDPEEIARRCIAFLISPAGRKAMQESKKRTDAFAEELKKMRPTKETWDWTPTI